MVSRPNFEDGNLIKLGEKAQKTGGDLMQRQRMSITLAGLASI